MLIRQFLIHFILIFLYSFPQLLFHFRLSYDRCSLLIFQFYCRLRLIRRPRDTDTRVRIKLMHLLLRTWWPYRYNIDPFGRTNSYQFVGWSIIFIWIIINPGCTVSIVVEFVIVWFYYCYSTILITGLVLEILVVFVLMGLLAMF